MWGPPASMTISKPTWSGKLKGKDVDRWIDLGGKESGEKWMACFYGDNGKNDAILSKQINTETTECTVTYLNKIPSAVEVICKW